MSKLMLLLRGILAEKVLNYLYCSKLYLLLSENLFPFKLFSSRPDLEAAS